MPIILGLALVLLSRALHLNAQIFTFNEEPFPESKSLVPLSIVYVFNHQDAPHASEGNPVVKFHDLSAMASSLKETRLKDSTSLQVSLILYREFGNRINEAKLCSTHKDVQSGVAKKENQLLVNKLKSLSNEDVHIYLTDLPLRNSPHWKSTDAQFTIRETGAYVLVLSNCGDLTDVKVRGTIIVKNAYGFLPANHFSKLRFYQWMSFFYMCIAAVWMLVLVRHWNELFRMQHCITLITVLGYVESFLWWVVYNDWNAAGHRGRFFFATSIIMSALKSILSLVLVVMACHGWGVTLPYLNKAVSQRLVMISIFYFPLCSMKQCALQLRREFFLSAKLVLLCILPVCLVAGYIVHWAFESLSDLLQTLKERQQSDKLLQFQRLWRLLILTLVLAMLAIAIQVLEHAPVLDVSLDWRYEWYSSDALPNFVFVLFLIGMMILWAPTQKNQRSAYSELGVKDDEDIDKENGVWQEEFVDDGDDDSFWQETHPEQSNRERTCPVQLDVSATTLGSPASQTDPSILKL